MMWAFRQLLIPANYLRIRHGGDWFHSKRTYDFVLPLMFAFLTWIIFWWIGVKLAVFEHLELVKRFSDLLALMIVFYMAALAAVATFDRHGIDDPLRGADALLYVRNPNGGAWKERKLSYRQFISYLFGYLSLLSLCLYVFLAVMAVGWPVFEEHLRSSPAVHDIIINWIDPALFFLTFFLIWQLLITSLLGIYFLTDRIQTLTDPES